MPASASPEKKHEWQEKIRNQQKSGLSIQKWCRENQIPVHAFHYWKRHLSSAPINRNSFTELVDSKGCSIDIYYQGVRLHLESSTLQECLAIFKELKC